LRVVSEILARTGFIAAAPRELKGKKLDLAVAEGLTSFSVNMINEECMIIESRNY